MELHRLDSLDNVKKGIAATNNVEDASSSVRVVKPRQRVRRPRLRNTPVRMIVVAEETGDDNSADSTKNKNKNKKYRKKNAKSLAEDDQEEDGETATPLQAQKSRARPRRRIRPRLREEVSEPNKAAPVAAAMAPALAIDARKTTHGAPVRSGSLKLRDLCYLVNISQYP